MFPVFGERGNSGSDKCHKEEANWGLGCSANTDHVSNVSNPASTELFPKILMKKKSSSFQPAERGAQVPGMAGMAVPWNVLLNPNSQLQPQQISPLKPPFALAFHGIFLLLFSPSLVLATP